MRSLLTLFPILLLAACSGGELVGIHLQLAGDGSGTVTTRALMSPNEVGQAETRATGAKWVTRAALVASQGTFDKIEDLKFGDASLTFIPQLDGERPGLRVHLKRGPGTAWIEALVPDQATRRKLAQAYDPTGRTNDIADVLRIEIVAPDEVITSGALPTGRGVVAEKENKRAYLLLPVRTAIEAGEDFVWEISWVRPN